MSVSCPCLPLRDCNSITKIGGAAPTLLRSPCALVLAPVAVAASRRPSEGWPLPRLNSTLPACGHLPHSLAMLRARQHGSTRRVLPCSTTMPDLTATPPCRSPISFNFSTVYQEGDEVHLVHVIPRLQLAATYGAPPVDFLPFQVRALAQLFAIQP